MDDSDGEGEEIYCYLSGERDGPAADFMGGIRTSLPADTGDTWNMEPFFLDSGTRPDSAIPSDTVTRLKLPIHKCEKIVATANGPTTSVGFVLLYVNLDLRAFNGGSKIGRLKCWVIPGIPAVHVGIKDIARFNLEPVVTALGQNLLAKEAAGVFEELPGFQCFPVSIEDKETKRHEPHPDPEIEEMLERFMAVFADKLDGRNNALPALNLTLLDPSAALPSTLKAKPRQQPLAWEKEIKAQLNDYVQQGIIEPCSSTFWSQILMVKKGDGKLRLCVDYRYLNKILKHEDWPLPKIQELLRKLTGNTYFGKVDMTQGYHQMALGEGAELTAFRVNGGIYRFKKVPFGLQSAPPYFQMAMQTKILDGLEDICLVYLDDCIIFGKSREEYLCNMETVLARLQERGILVKRSKCQFGLTKILFLGHEVTGGSVSLAEDRKQALRDLAKPKTVSQLRSFLGMANFFRQFIDNYALIARDLHQLAATSKTKVLVWTQTLEAAWEAVKKAVVGAPELSFLTQNPEDEITLYTDASDFAFGGHLVQLQNGVEKSILFYSKTFNPVQARWSTSDKEMYSIVHGVKSNHYLLMGRKFTIKSDHKALMFNERVSASNKIERWKVSLSEYDISWRFIEGKSNVIADAMSRVVDVDVENLNDAEDIDDDDLVCLVLNEMTSEGGADAVEESSVGIEEFKLQEIKIHHSPAHFGEHDTLASLKKHGFAWRGIAKDVDEYLKSCRLCQMLKTRTNPGHAAVFTLKKEKPGEEIAMDVMELEEDFFGHAFILVLVDCCTSYTTLVPLRSIRAGEIYHALIKYFCDDGVPDSLHYDQGSTLNANIVRSLLNFLKVNSIVTAPRSSQQNGIAEQKIGRVRQVLRLLIEERVADADSFSWSLVVPYAQRAINIMTGSNGFTPAEIRFGLFNRLDSLKELIVPDEIAKDQRDVQEGLKQALVRRKAKKAIIEGTKFRQNEKVIIKNPLYLKRNAAHKPYLGPFRVEKQTETSLFLYKDGDPTVRKEVKTSEVFRFRDMADKEIGVVDGLVAIPAIRPATASGGDEPMLVNDSNSNSPSIPAEVTNDDMIT